MFYSEAILSRRGPLGKVWLAAHMERKLSKTQTLQTDIEQSVDAIMGQEIEVMALRLSGQLLLGVVRIYSRKAKYLLDDCNEALLKIKMAFRPGVVDLTEDQLAVNKNAITLQTDGVDLDMFMPDLNWDADLDDRPRAPQGQHQANIDDITLRAAEDFAQYDFNDPYDLGPSDGIGSNDFDVDLGLDWGDGTRARDEDTMDVDESMEVGRDADIERASIGSQFLGNNDVEGDFLSRGEPSEHNFGMDMDVDVPDFSGMDLGEFGIGFGDQPEGEREKTPSQARLSTRASSPLSEAPKTPPPAEGEIGPQEEATPKAKRKPRERKQIIDSVIEMQDGPGARAGRGRNAAIPTRDVSDIVQEQQFLPRDATVMRFLQIRDDPLAHFMPTRTTEEGTFVCVAPPGIAPQLAELFMRPVGGGKRQRDGSPAKSPKKRKTNATENGDDEDVEQARREESLAPSVAARSDLAFDQQMDFADQTAGFEDFPLDVPDMPDDGRAPSAAPTNRTRSRLSTPAGDGPLDEEQTYADASCPIAIFDPPSSQSQEAEVVDTEGKGYSRNTIKALSIVRRELQPSAGEGERVLSFNEMAHKASRRAAASFFFELLVLGTRDCVIVTQRTPFDNIEVIAKDKLWEKQRHEFSAAARFESSGPSEAGSPGSSRAPSVARSLGTALGL